MNVESLVKFIHLMGPFNTSEKAISNKRISLLWEGYGSDPNAEPDPATLRQIQRFTYRLSKSFDDNAIPPLLNYVEEDASIYGASKKGDKTPRKQRLFYLHHDSLMSWFMSEQAALNIAMTGQVVGQALGEVTEIGVKAVTKLANDVISGRKSAKLSRIASSVRFLPDGIGRLPARLEANLLQTIIDAIVRDNAVSFDYKTPTGERGRRVVNPLGLVSKEGTMYLVASKGREPVVIHYALQRASNASVERRHVRNVPDGFDLDNHINETHRFSHQTGPEMNLVLQVNEEAIFHFKERPLTEDQQIKKIKGTDIYKVSALVPDSYYLRPFLLSLRANVTVVEPIEYRKSIAAELKEMVKNYTANN